MIRRAFLQTAAAALLRAAAKPETYLAHVIAALRIDWPKNRAVRIVSHGHSVPAGYFKTPVVQTFDAYPHLLHKALTERYPHAVINMIVTAIGGESSPSGAARFDRGVLSLRPDVVLIDYGLNDRGPGLEIAREAWTSMIGKAQEAGVKVILLTPTGDSAANLLNAEDKLMQHAEQVRRLAAEFSVGLADSTQAYVSYIKGGGKIEDLLSQRNHPNRAGHELVAKALMEWF